MKSLIFNSFLKIFLMSLTFIYYNTVQIFYTFTKKIFFDFLTLQELLVTINKNNQNFAEYTTVLKKSYTVKPILFN